MSLMSLSGVHPWIAAIGVLPMANNTDMGELAPFKGASNQWNERWPGMWNGMLLLYSYTLQY